MSIRRPRYYVLNADNQPVPEPDMMRWAQWFEHANRRVDYTQITSVLTVSTVFLGVDHRHFGKGPPVLYETMVFGDADDTDHGEDRRYSTWDDAATGHAMVVKRLRQKQRARPRACAT